MITEAGAVSAPKVVIAAGHGLKQPGPPLGLDIPIRPQRGHILVTERTKQIPPMPMSSFRQTVEGSIMLGVSAEEAEHDATINTGAIAKIAERAARTIPALRDLNIARTWAALRVPTPDKCPIYAKSQTHPRGLRGSVAQRRDAGGSKCQGGFGVDRGGSRAGRIRSLWRGEVRCSNDGIATRRWRGSPIDGEPVEARAGESVAAAMFAHAEGATRTTPVNGAPRAPCRMMGACFECLMEINGAPNRRARMVRVAEGLAVERRRCAREMGGGACQAARSGHRNHRRCAREMGGGA